MSASVVLCVGGAHLHGNHLPTVLVPPELDRLPPLLVVGGGWVPFDVELVSLVYPRDVVPMCDLARGLCELEGQLNSGPRLEVGVYGGGFLLGPTFWLGL